jgi:hypothetical protein
MEAENRSLNATVRVRRTLLGRITYREGRTAANAVAVNDDGRMRRVAELARVWRL